MASLLFFLSRILGSGCHVLCDGQILDSVAKVNGSLCIRKQEFHMLKHERLQYFTQSTSLLHIDLARLEVNRDCKGARISPEPREKQRNRA